MDGDEKSEDCGCKDGLRIFLLTEPGVIVGFSVLGWFFFFWLAGHSTFSRRTTDSNIDETMPRKFHADSIQA